MTKDDHRKGRARILGIAGALSLSAAALIACTTHEATRLADGTLVYRISCSGTRRPMVNCLEQGDTLCRSQGYRILGRRGEEISLTELMIAERIAEEMGLGSDRAIAIVCEPAPTAEARQGRRNGVVRHPGDW
ncbi:hypothetical protein [Plastoroseomonas hellenica]|uniref:hypothetical protein n=1 Tax=Plastoroseomonas hellenica TaxID=2687306 RepID=UPI001BA454B2|nr:hypothetical protein [Plastoroseomonas hellenica]MBR0643098.1 hypothetical protein [Plastoroseomonas hellenica]